MGVWQRALNAALVAASLLGALAPSPGRASTEVDLALVVAVDISYSMDPEEQELQREGFAQAFRSPLVQEAIRRGMSGRIGVTYVEWAGASDQRVVIPWTVLDNPETIGAFADRISAVPLRRAQRTSIAGAIDFSVRQIESSGLEAQRKVIDVSGDGPNNQGRFVTLARDEAVAKGITVNALPMMLKKPGYFDIPELDRYFKDCVIGGQGAFMIPARSRDEFQQAIRTKILLEISGLTPPGPLIVPAQAEAPTNCLVGETQWRDRMGN